MSCGERSCGTPKPCPLVASLSDEAIRNMCNVDCPHYAWDGKTTPDSKPTGANAPRAFHADDGRPVGLAGVPARRRFKIGRNDFCPCRSGLKYKRCCGR